MKPSKTDMEMSTFGELADVIDQLHIIVLNARRAARLSQRDLARLTGLSFATVSRVEQGRELSSVSMSALLRWLDTAGRSL